MSKSHIFIGLSIIAGVLAGPPAQKPVWPQEFDAPFGLYNLSPASPILNASAHFYYNYDQLQSQVIQYPTNCIPIFGQNSNFPCALYFNSAGTYLSQPTLGLECCLLIPDVGAVPPSFLQGFTWNSTQTAPNLYGQETKCDYWTSGASGFAYWTQLNTGFDVFFQDGPTGTYWAWGDFNVVSQPSSVFALPGNSAQCAASCFPDHSSKTKKLLREHVLKHVPIARLAPLAATGRR